MKTATFNLRTIAEDADVDTDTIDRLVGWCQCGNEIGQDVDNCAQCGTPVIWRGSKAWAGRFLSPKDELASYLSRKAYPKSRQGLRFKNGHDHHLWKRIIQEVPPAEVREVIDYCARNASGRGLVRYTLNSLKLRITAETEDEGGIVL